MTTHVCNDVALSQLEAHCYRDTQFRTIDGRARYIRTNVAGLVMEINKREIVFALDETALKVAENVKGANLVKFVYWVDIDDNRKHIATFTNISAQVNVINRKMNELIELQAKRKEMYNRHHNILTNAVKSRHIFVLVNKATRDEACFGELVGVRGDYEDNIQSYDNALRVFDGIELPQETKDWLRNAIPLGRFGNVPGLDNYVFGAFQTTDKVRDCSHCASEAHENGTQNHSIVYGNGFRTYLCEYCFFDYFKIAVPQDYESKNRIST